ncbi:MAG: CopG family transcriptional regulator [Halanaerobiales bacterium]|nr:CopG family transcriptional regulator [Halanaerobiales bacterium]
MKRVQIHLPETLIELLDKDGKTKGISRAEMIRRILDAYYEKRGE